MCPLVISQAFSYGLPVIASRIGGLSEIVEDGITGLLFEPGDHEDLGWKIRCLWNDPEPYAVEWEELDTTNTILELGGRCLFRSFDEKYT